MSQHQIHVYEIVRQAAVNGERCPTNADIAQSISNILDGRTVAASSIPSVFMKLVRDGLITVRVYGNNWRDVTLLTGKDAGKTTLPPPHGGKPHTTIDQAERIRRDSIPKWNRR